MRLAYLALLAACSVEEGSLLTVRAPDGPDNVARLEIVLANAAEDRITTIDQRVAPTMLDAERARYYRQHATAGVLSGVGEADGLTIRIEPNLAVEDQKQFIPFLVAYDAKNNVVGVGAVLDSAGEPSSILIEETTRQYFVDMVALKPMDPAVGMADRESILLACESGWDSGIAWRPGATQLRLLYPDRSEDPNASDASEREADLDCDGYVAPSQDCDDLRATFHTGRADVCDTMDSNCDGARTVVSPCTLGTCPNNGGVQLCDDRTGQPIGACIANAQCACENGTGAGCNQCTLDFRATADTTRRAPCAPAVGKMHFACNEQVPCNFEVLPSSNLWQGYISTMQTGGFATKLSNVTAGEIWIEAKMKGTSDVLSPAGASVGALNLMLTQAGQTRLVSIDLRLSDDPVTACTPIENTSTFNMYCSP
jgi:hypothetical protein